MTIEKAIEVLNGHLEKLLKDGTCLTDEGEETIEALKVVIEALSEISVNPNASLLAETKKEIYNTANEATPKYPEWARGLYYSLKLIDKIIGMHDNPIKMEVDQND